MQKKLDSYTYYSLPDLLGKKSRLPISIRILLESVMRNCDGKKITQKDVQKLANWNAKKPEKSDIPFCVARVILQDFTGVPLLADLAAMRDAVKNPQKVEPLVPVDLVIDHSVQVDRSGSQDAFLLNLGIEFERNRERYEFLKWGQEAFKTFKVIPPGIGIVHQVNLEYIATVVTEKDGVLYPDTLVGTDSHTTMINGLGVVGWGVGGIEAEAAMLGQPVSLQMPEVIGVHLYGKIPEGSTATDLTLRVTELLRKENVVGKFVEFFGEGTASLTVADRATIGNMAPEYGATMGFFPVDEKTLDYLKMTGRSEEHIALVEKYLKAQELFGVPREGEIDYTKVLELDLSSIKPSIAGPKRPQDRIHLPDLKKRFEELFAASPSSGGYGKPLLDLEKPYYLNGKDVSSQAPQDAGGTEQPTSATAIWSEKEMLSNRPMTDPIIAPGYGKAISPHASIKHGSIVIAAITSCTNTSNPYVMIAAGLLAKKAVEKGLSVNPIIKTSLAPGSRIVTDYLKKTDLQQYLDKLGFNLVAYGCTTCIGNSGPLNPSIENPIKEHDLITASVLSGNRNFEARIHSSVKANFLMSPPLVVAFALAGTVNLDISKDPIGQDPQGNKVYLKDIWPSSQEVFQAMAKGIQPEMFKKRYANIMEDNPVWATIPPKTGARYPWDPKSTYIRKPPFFEVAEKTTFTNMRPLMLLGDSVTTDHISPAGAFKSDTPAGKYLIENGIQEEDFNSYGSRRGNHEVMMRGTFANVRIMNKMAKGKEGGFTAFMPEGIIMPIYDACQKYKEQKTPLIIFAGKDYGMGSSRDWAAKGTLLLGVKAVIARSFERIHRSNLIGMGVLPLQFQNNDSWESVGITGTETFTIHLEKKLAPGQEATLEFNGKKVKLNLCIETPIEAEYYEQGGILHYVLKQIQ
jgi:aconitate hydratase